MPQGRTCTSCGALLPPDGELGLCSTCVLAFGVIEVLDLRKAEENQTIADTSGGPFRSEERAGDRIGRYKLLRKIGEGGFGSVWIAEQEEPVRRRAALKVIKMGMDTRQVIARFEAERQALAMMDHPNIAKVLDAGATEAGRPFFVMELVKGIPITEYCDKHQLTTRERVQLFIKVCQAIQHAHQKMIIHRDIKPSNILVEFHEGTPVPKVIDFGIAKATDHRLTEKTIFTSFEQFMGTPAYMSPEQAEMSELDIDTRSDIYSLGVLLYELLTGKTPFETKTLLASGLDAMRRAIREQEPPRPSTRLTTMVPSDLQLVAKQRRSDVPKLIHLIRGDLDWIVMKALEKDRTRRYETANGLAMDIQRHLDNEPIRARPPSNLYRFQKTVRRNKAAFAAAGGLAGLMLLGLIAASWLLAEKKQALNRAVAAEQQTRIALQQTKSALQAEEALRRKTEEMSFNAYLSQARLGRASGRAGQRFDSLDAISKAAALKPSSPELINEAIASLALPDLRPAKHWAGLPPGASALGIDSRFELYARAEANGNISVRRVEGDKELFVLSNGGSAPTQLRFSHKGRLLISEHSDNSAAFLQVWDLDRKQRLYTVGDVQPGAWDLSFDDQTIAAATEGGSIQLIETKAGRSSEITIKDRERPLIKALAFSPEADRLAILSATLAAYIIDRGTGEVLRELIHRARVNAIAWDPQGSSIASACADMDIYVWNLEATRLEPLRIKAGDAEPLRLAFTHGGESLGSFGTDGKLRLWHPLMGRELVQAGHTFSSPLFQFSEDDRLLCCTTAGSEVTLWETAPGREARVLYLHPRSRKGPTHLDVSSDGRLLASAAEDGVELWDMPRWKNLAFLKTSETTSVLFDSDQPGLYTTGVFGFHRFPFNPALSSGASTVQLGPPLRIQGPLVRHVVASRGGEFVARIHQEHVDISEKGGESSKLQPDARLTGVAISPDGRWVATDALPPQESRLWERASGQVARSLPVGGGARFAFSPDSKSLLGCGKEEYCCWKLEPWSLLWRLPSTEGNAQPGVAAFSPDGILAALAKSPSEVLLVRADTGDALATLTARDQNHISYLLFTPDNRQLLVATDNHVVECWNLPAVRAELARLKLDWNLPAYPPLQPRSFSPLLVHAEVGDLSSPAEPMRQAPDSGTAASESELQRATSAIEANPRSAEAYHTRGHVHERAGEHLLALTDFSESLKLLPTQDRVLGDKARMLAHLNRTTEALEAIDDAIKIAPANSSHLTLRGSINLSRHNYPAALENLTAALSLNSTNADSLFYRGWVYAEQAQWEKARSDFEHAVALDPDLPNYRGWALAVLAKGDTKAYGGICKTVFNKFGRDSNHNQLATVVRLCALIPEAFKPAGELVAVAERSVQAHPDNVFFLATLALARYRSGDFSGALTTVGKAYPDLRKGVSSVGEVGAALVAAASHGKLGHLTESAEYLEKARQGLAKVMAQETDSAMEADWANRQQLIFLAREAEVVNLEAQSTGKK